MAEQILNYGQSIDGLRIWIYLTVDCGSLALTPSVSLGRDTLSNPQSRNFELFWPRTN